MCPERSGPESVAGFRSRFPISSVPEKGSPANQGKHRVGLEIRPDLVTRETANSHQTPLDPIDYDLEDPSHPRINFVVRMDDKVIEHILFLPSEVVVGSSDDERHHTLEVPRRTPRRLSTCGPPRPDPAAENRRSRRLAPRNGSCGDAIVTASHENDRSTENPRCTPAWRSGSFCC